MRRLFSRGSSSHSTARTAYREPGYNFLRDAEVKACQWPCESFMGGAGIKLELEQFVENAGMTALLADKCPQYHLLTNTFVQNFNYITGRSGPRVVFHLYNRSISMSLEECCHACKIPFWGSLTEPRKADFEVFLMSLCNGETRGVTQGRIGSIHFPAVHYFAYFIGRCVTGKQDPSASCAPNLSILCSALYGDRTYNIGAIIARRLSKNAGSDDVYGGIYATRIPAHFEIPIRLNEDHELPTSLLDFEAMQRHGFIDYRAEANDYRYNLIFDMYNPVIITLPAPYFI